jgi:hypothetical protein
MRTYAILALFLVLLTCVRGPAQILPPPIEITDGWMLQDVAKVPATGVQVSRPAFQSTDWYPAVVPGTVLTSLVQAGVYPEPLYGENNRPDKIPESLCRTSYWYRTAFKIPDGYAGRTIWLNFDGINYTAEVWVNGQKIGNIAGAFARGTFNLTPVVKAGEFAALAVHIVPQPNPGHPNEKTIATGTGHNGGDSARDGPTFLCTVGWDWIPGIRDRDTGIWQKVYLSATGPVVLKEPDVTTDLAMPKLDSADVRIQARLQNTSNQPLSGIFKGTFGDVPFSQAVQIAANATAVVTVDPGSQPQLHIPGPKLWWPNGYGPQNLYPVHLQFETGAVVSDSADFSVGVRKITYTAAGSQNLTVSVNGVPVMCKGGDWGMDEAMKRIPRARLEAEVRMHALANYTIIRNWVGQSTSEDLYELCDQYGIMLWDEFFQPNPGDGPNPDNVDVYLANARDKVLRFRNHPSIAIWCGRNEGMPPDNINAALSQMMAELDPDRLYQPSSASGHGVNSHGPYYWRPARNFYGPFKEAFKTEVGSVSVPTLEAVQAMMPQKDWETINDDWAEHDLTKGAQRGDSYPGALDSRYGQTVNLADFVRKAQLANYEAFRAMYEGRFAELFHPETGVITWMSNPAQPSFVWQLYSHDLEPNASLFAVRKACEPVHIMLNEKTGHVMVVNNRADAIPGAKATLTIYNLDGTKQYGHDWNVDAPPSAATDLGAIDWPAKLSPVHFVQLQLMDEEGGLVSRNFYWRGLPASQDNLQDLEKLPTVTLTTKLVRRDTPGTCLIDVTLTNPSDQVALMAHVQLRRERSGDRVLPVYYSENYISLAPHEERALTIEAAQADLQADQPLVVVDGWNINVNPSSAPGVSLALNKAALPSSWPVTNIPIVRASSPASP